mgnify:CR=1 FL=1
MHLRSSAALLSLGLLAAACAPNREQPDPGDCSPAAAEIAVRIHVSDLQGLSLTPSTVTFQVDDGTLRDAVCVDDACTEWVTGFGDSAGQYLVFVELDKPLEDDPFCFEWASETALVDVEEGSCGVATETISVSLDVQLICSDGDGGQPAPGGEDSEPAG